MVALLVVTTFLAFIAIDVLLHRAKYRFDKRMGATPVFAGVALPETLAYHPAHTWALDAGNGRIRVGLDEFAARLLGPIERIEVPQRGRWFRQGEKGWTVFTGQGAAGMLAPAEGEIVAVNAPALARPETIGADPYGSGWLLEVFSPDALVSFRNLLNGAVAARWMEQSVADLRRALSPLELATAADGGRISPQLGLELPNEKWRELTRQFFRA